MVGDAVQILDESCLAQQAQRLCEQSQYDLLRRYMVGIAGIPGSGKSTLASLLVERINRDEPGLAVVIPMDGFHLTSKRLSQLGLADLKGSPRTFDGEGYVELLARARDATQSLVFPVYDRKLHEPVLRDDPRQKIGPATRIIITEGNYLLMDEEPWSRLGGILNETWLLDTPIATARRWILDRHVKGGKERQAATEHYNRTDLGNAQLVLQYLREPDWRFRWPEK